jgi:hypothetical protein
MRNVRQLTPPHTWSPAPVMSDLDPKNNPERQSLSSEEYRVRLVNKLNCLIAVLEVAISKITRSVDTAPDRADRLLKIRANLENTLAICRRARGTLETKSTASAQMPPKQLPPAKHAKRGDVEKMTYRDYVEFLSVEEYRRFKTLPPITDREIKSLDFDNLIGRLQGF